MVKLIIRGRVSIAHVIKNQTHSKLFSILGLKSYAPIDSKLKLPSRATHGHFTLVRAGGWVILTLPGQDEEFEPEVSSLFGGITSVSSFDMEVFKG